MIASSKAETLVRAAAVRACIVGALVGAGARAARADEARPGPGNYDESIKPILVQYCYDCHGNGASEGGMSLDRFATSSEAQRAPDHWWKVLKQLRAGLMPPRDEARPSEEQVARLEHWILFSVFQADPQNPDPGRVTLRRLNRVEYRNTIRDLLGVDYNTEANFPADDTGEGFDSIADVLTVSPLLLEKYLEAAKDIIAEAVPTTSGVVPERELPGAHFRDAEQVEGDAKAASKARGPLTLSYYEPASKSLAFDVEHDGQYVVKLDLRAVERYVDNQFDYNKCRFQFGVDGEVLLDREFVRQGGQSFRFEFPRAWKAGRHTFFLKLESLTDEEQIRSLRLLVNSVTIAGPEGKEHLVPPPNYARFFPRPVPQSVVERRAYARDLLTRFASRAFRRPVDEPTLKRLVALAEQASSADGTGFEAGIAQAMTAVLASPRFLFREEQVLPQADGRHPLVDEYSLASRLSYFLWSSMPDEELLTLAAQGQLRARLDEQVERMLTDERSSAFFTNFAGQWLRARDIESVQINSFAVAARERGPDPEGERRRARFRELRNKSPEDLTDAERTELAEIGRSFFRPFRDRMRIELDGELRRAMRRETEMLFEHVVRENRPLTELIDAPYTFLNERLAQHYEIDDGVRGNEMRRVDLPTTSPRGGVLTQGTILAVTSNPDRTSPVKRGVFVLENLLGIPPAAPPPDIPALEESETRGDGTKLSLREGLAVHRSNALCSSCHNRMDPLGLALENFNALGRWRESERGQKIDAAGTLVTGESFNDVRELKQILATRYRREFYRCLTEKLLTYAVGRSLQYNDVFTVDQIVERIEAEDGRALPLISGIIESAAFQRSRALDR